MLDISFYLGKLSTFTFFYVGVDLTVILIVMSSWAYIIDVEDAEFEKFYSEAC